MTVGTLIGSITIFTDYKNWKWIYTKYGYF